MSNTMIYKEYEGTVEYSREDGCLYGKVLGIRSLISYEGKSLGELEEDFHGAVNDYLEVCKAKGWEPEKPFKGSFNARLGQENHRNLALDAMRQGKSLNSVLREIVTNYYASVTD